MNGNRLTEQQAADARKKYVEAYNSTMVDIWVERIQKLGVVDTGALIRSVSELPILLLKNDYTDFQISHEFLTYGLWQDLGTGREVYRGNPGDIGRDKIRERRPWFNPKLYASTQNLKEFMADNLKDRVFGIVGSCLDSETFRRLAW